MPMVVLNERYPLKKTTIILLSLLIISPTLSAYSHAVQHDQKNSFNNRLQAKVAKFQERLVPFVAKMRTSPVVKKAAYVAAVAGSVLLVAYAYNNKDKNKSELDMQRSPSGLSPSTASGSNSLGSQSQPEQPLTTPRSPKLEQTLSAQQAPLQPVESPKKLETPAVPATANGNNGGYISSAVSAASSAVSSAYNAVNKWWYKQPEQSAASGSAAVLQAGVAQPVATTSMSLQVEHDVWEVPSEDGHPDDLPENGQS